MILVIANMGIERITPGMPHIQNQKASEMMTRTGFRVNRRRRRRLHLAGRPKPTKTTSQRPGQCSQNMRPINTGEPIDLQEREHVS
jgi:hypothetical protein